MDADSESSMQRQKVSVLVPFHRERELLARAVRSVQQQTVSEWQLVLVANNADSETVNIAHSMAQDDRRISLLTEDKPGIAYALNTGLQACSGDYVARLDADDAMPPDRLELQSAYLDTHAETSLVSGQVEFVTENGAGYNAYVDQINGWKTPAEMFRYRFVESPVAHPSVMFRRSLITKHGKYSTEPIPEDYELWLRWLTRGERFDKIDSCVLYWHDTPGRLSRSHAHYARQAFDRVRLQYLAQTIPLLAAGRPVWVCGGRYARRKATALAKLGIRITGIVDLVPRTLQGMQSMTYDDLPQPGSIYLISMVSNRGGYRIVEDVLLNKGYRSEIDFLLSA